MGLLRVLLLAAVLAGMGWFEFGQPLTALELAQRARDLVDARPARRILILGNSRTYYNNMPSMIRAMADSAGDRMKYQIKTEALPGASFESLWNRPEMAALLTDHWDDAIVQSESRAQVDDKFDASFQNYGAKLIGAIRLKSGAPRLVVNWNYGRNIWPDGDPGGDGRAAYRTAIREGAVRLADRTGAHLVDVEKIWSNVSSNYPDIVLTSDGNHPTLAGSYLYALALYADLSGVDPGCITFVPNGLDSATADTLRSVAQNTMPMSR